jgi:hypothetical protein
LQSAINSSSGANAPGVYSRPDDAPHAPCASASSTIAVMRANSAAVAGRSSLPTTIPRRPPSPTIDATFTAGWSLSIDAKSDVKDRSSPLSSAAVDEP